MRDWIHDPLWVLASFAAVFALLSLTRLTRSWGAEAHRKLLHIGVGAWVLFVTPRFHMLAFAILPPLAFFGLNMSGKLRAALPELSGDAASMRGLWTFPLGVAATYAAFWSGEGRAAILAGVAALTFADPAAAWVGKRWGQRRYRGFGFGRSLEGSLAFLVVAGAAAAWVATGVPTTHHPLRFAVGCGVTGALVEAIAPPGYDNLGIPILVAAAFGSLL